MRRPAMPLFGGDYLADTQHLETVQHGAYLLLIMHYWANEGLPDDDRQLAKITKLPLNSWRQMRPTIQHFFHDGWRHKRIDAELHKYDERIARLKVSGSKGGTKASLARAKTRYGPDGNSSLAIAQHAAARPQHTTLQAGNSNHNHKDITSSSFTTTAARARETEKNPAKTSDEDNQRQESVSPKPPSTTASLSTNTDAAATKNSGSAMTADGIGSSAELATLLAAKGWR